MKNKFLALGAAVVLFASCSSDDSGSSIDQSQLQKKWYYVSYSVGGENIPYDDHEACGKDYIEFKANGVFRSIDVFNCVEMSEGDAAYTVNGNKITLTMGGQSTTGTVTELTAQTLKVQASYDFDDDGDNDTVTEIYTSTP